MTSQIAMIVGVLAAVLLVVGSALAARRIVSQAKDNAKRVADDIVAESRREAEARAQGLLSAAQEKSIAVEEESDRRERDLDQREAKIDVLARQREGDLAAVERQRKDLERRQAAIAAAEERVKATAAEAERDRGEARGLLERIAKLTVAEARTELLASI